MGSLRGEGNTTNIQKMETEAKLRAEKKAKYKIGMAAALLCAVIWGFLPIYWHSLRPIESSVIIFYRIFLVGVSSFILALIFYGWGKIKAPLKQKGAKLKFFTAGLIITANWSLYIWAVNADFLIQTCIGYYIEPLMVCIFGILFFKEKLTIHKLIALILAGVGVIILLVHFKEIPLIALSLALTFATYAALKKQFNIEAILSLFYETMFLAPIALAIIIYLEVNGQGAIGVAQPYQYVLLLFSGILTAIPLGLFAVAANKITLVSLGITEYISPSISLLIGIFLFKEPFDGVQFMSFVIIWVGLVLFTAGELRESQKEKAQEAIEDKLLENAIRDGG